MPELYIEHNGRPVVQCSMAAEILDGMYVTM